MVRKREGKRRGAEPPVARAQHFDDILAIVALAGTDTAREILRDIGDALFHGAPFTPWTDAVQLARDVGGITDEQAFGLLDVITERALEPMIFADPLLNDLGAMLDDIQLADGLGEDEAYHIDDAPPEWQAINLLWDQRFEAMQVALFRSVGEPRMAAMLLLRSDEFEELTSRARRELFAFRDEAADPLELFDDVDEPL
ncbi:MAG: hypothetical protein ABI625_00275 [bacterium]